MFNVFSAFRHRLFRTAAFWICIALLTLIQLQMIGMRIQIQMTADPADSQVTFESIYFNLIPLSGLLFSVFISWFIGSDLSSGTLKHALLSGISRSQVFLAYYLVCALGIVTMILVSSAAGLSGLLYFKSFSFGWQAYCLFILIYTAGSLALTAVFTAVAVNSSSQASAIVINLVIYLAILFVSSSLYNDLCEPDMVGGMMLSEGGFKMMDPAPNPAYISGIRRQIYEAVTYISPVGQQIYLADQSMAHPVWSLLADGGIIFAGCLTG